MIKPKWHRNLSKRRPKEAAKGCGRVQRACRRALIVHDGVVSTSQAIDWAFGTRLLHEERRNYFNKAVRRALLGLGAARVKRMTTGKGRPWLWELS